MRQWVVRVCLGLAFVLACWSVVEFDLAVRRAWAATSQLDGLMGLDFSPDGAQRDLYIALVLLLGLIAAESRTWARRALIAAAFAYFGLEPLFWFATSRVGFDTVDTLAHISAGIALGVGVTMFKSGWRPSSIAALAPGLVLVEYVSWAADTARIRRAHGFVEVLQPPTMLNNLLFEAQWHHAMTVLMVIVALMCLAMPASAASPTTSLSEV